MKLKNIIHEPFQSRKLFAALFIILLAVLAFMALYKSPDDPDLGWHLQTGKMIWETKSIPRTDWYSYTFAHFRWVDHEYLSNLLMYGISASVGKFGVSIFYTALAVVTLFVVLKFTAVEKISWTHAALYGAIISPMFLYFIGARPQVATWFFVASVLAILATMKRNHKSKAYFLLPPLFLLWANLHGGSVFIGIVVLGMYLFVEGAKVFYFWDGKENDFLLKKNAYPTDVFTKLLIVTAISVGVTFVNPYGYRMYEELIRTATDSYSLSRINEWLSPDFKQSTGLLLLIYMYVVVQAMYLRRKARIDFTYFVFFLAFFFLATQSVRHIPLFVLVMSPFLLESTKRLFDVYLEPVLQKKVVFTLVASAALLSFFNFNDFFTRWYTSLSDHRVADAAGYPEAAVTYIRTKNLQGNMFNMYGWGGYLIEKMPERKVFIDGRMPHWRENGLHVFRDYNTITHADTAWIAKMEQYDIRFALLNHGTTLEKVLRETPTWEQAYSDHQAIIFVKK